MASPDRSKPITFDAFVAQVQIFATKMQPELDRCSQLDWDQTNETSVLSSRYFRSAVQYCFFKNAKNITAILSQIKTSKRLEKLNDWFTLQSFERSLRMYEKVILFDAMYMSMPRKMLGKEFADYARKMSMPCTAKNIDWIIKCKPPEPRVIARSKKGNGISVAVKVADYEKNGAALPDVLYALKFQVDRLREQLSDMPKIIQVRSDIRPEIYTLIDITKPRPN